MPGGLLYQFCKPRAVPSVECHPFGQPLDGGRAGVAYRDLDRTVDRLGTDGHRWRRLLGPLTAYASEVAAISLSDKRSVPQGHPLRLARAAGAFGVSTALLARSWGDSYWSTEEARSLIGGVSAHTISWNASPGPSRCWNSCKLQSVAASI